MGTALGRALRAGFAAVLTAMSTEPLRAQSGPDGLITPNLNIIAQTQPQRAKSRPLISDQLKTRAMNAWTVGLAAGRTEGAPLQFAAELARALDDGDNLRIMPIVTRGVFDNIYDILYLRGVDAAIVYSDALDHIKTKPEFARLRSRVTYLLSLFPSEVHVFARPEIRTLGDLAGKTVNFNTQGTAASFSGPIIFRQLGIDVRPSFVPHTVAMEKMKQGDEFAATFWISSKPLAPFLKGTWPEGFKFLPVEYSDRLEYYLPTQLEHSDYPLLIPEQQKIATISVPAILAVFDWPKNTDRYRRLLRVVDYLFDRLEILQKEPGYHEKWKDVNLAAKVPGWARFGPMQEKLNRIQVSGSPAHAQVRDQLGREKGQQAPSSKEHPRRGDAQGNQ
jgi:hypothetical protein